MGAAEAKLRADRTRTDAREIQGRIDGVRHPPFEVAAGIRPGRHRSDDDRVRAARRVEYHCSCRLIVRSPSGQLTVVLVRVWGVVTALASAV
jgi:hypothetical protein